MDRHPDCSDPELSYMHELGMKNAEHASQPRPDPDWPWKKVLLAMVAVLPDEVLHEAGLCRLPPNIFPAAVARLDDYIHSEGAITDISDWLDIQGMVDGRTHKQYVGETVRSVGALLERVDAVRKAWAQYQRNDLSREEFEGAVAELAEGPYPLHNATSDLEER